MLIEKELHYKKMFVALADLQILLVKFTLLVFFLQSYKSPITIKENPLTCVPVFSETAEPICKVGIPIESSWHGQRPHAARFPEFCLSFE